MTGKDFKIARKLRNILSHFVGLQDFRIFGSRAKGNSDEYSDMDVFIEVNKLYKELKEKILEEAWKVSLENLIVISVIIFTKNEIQNTPLRSSPLLKNIYRNDVKV